MWTPVTLDKSEWLRLTRTKASSFPRSSDFSLQSKACLFTAIAQFSIVNDKDRKLICDNGFGYTFNKSLFTVKLVVIGGQRKQASRVFIGC